MSERKADEIHEAYEIVYGERPDAPFVITCEHASQRLPEPWTWPEADRRLLDTHWAYDIGALEAARDLRERLGCTLIASRFTRLLIDPNRSEGSDTLFRELCDGLPVELNQGIDAEDRQRRISTYLRSYHRAVDRVIGRSQASVLCSMHSFTPVYEGSRRHMEIGVLYDLDEALALRVAEGLIEAGFVVALNEPYSGRNGMMYAIDRHAREHGKQALEIELRQDLAPDPRFRARLAEALDALLRAPEMA